MVRIPVNPLAARPWRRLSVRLLVASSAIPCLAILLLGSALLRVFERSLEHRIQEEDVRVANSAAAAVDLALTSGRDLLRMLADDPAVRRGDRARCAELFRDVRLNSWGFESLALVDRAGTTLVTLPEVAARTPVARPTQVAGATTPGTRRVHHENEDGMPLLALAEPVRREGQITGEVRGELRLWTLEAQLASLSSRYTYAYLADGDGDIMVHPDLAMPESSSRAPAPALQRGGRYRSPQGAEVLGAQAPVPGTTWKVVVETPVETGLHDVGLLRRLLLGLALVVGAVTATAGALIVRGVTAPVEHLVAGARRLGSGDVHARVEIASPAELADLAQEFNDMAARLAAQQERIKRAEGIRTLGAVGSVLSHEIRNPLNALALQLELLRRELNRSQIDRDAALRRQAAVLEEERRIERITASYLEMVRSPGHAPEPLQPQALLDELAAAEGPVAAAVGVEVRRDGDDSGVPRVLADREALFRALRNLVRNALDAMPQGGILTLRARRHGDTSVVLEVEDTGCGIEPEVADRAFQFRFTTKEHGSGIGLPLAEALVERHGGRLDLESTPGKGTRARITLPAMRAEEAT